eukprot:gnl/MRDRNA2_/MRDRNA2_116106_c0_seq1.p1 gnl/MRDRNA2_/MRDRNA2_116106_c0~~gnl/MRDRNA2_/MRDRNA2_116106_c0_seq1.p1  ORF type:complete len:320 (-),score=46.82 gnl/MRDRNA2_/MRDRNA2_116106_c0_seq1:504-1463(-)
MTHSPRAQAVAVFHLHCGGKAYVNDVTLAREMLIALSPGSKYDKDVISRMSKIQAETDSFQQSIRKEFFEARSSMEASLIDLTCAVKALSSDLAQCNTNHALSLASSTGNEKKTLSSCSTSSELSDLDAPLNVDIVSASCQTSEAISFFIGEATLQPEPCVVNDISSKSVELSHQHVRNIGVGTSRVPKRSVGTAADIPQFVRAFDKASDTSDMVDHFKLDHCMGEVADTSVSATPVCSPMSVQTDLDLQHMVLWIRSMHGIEDLNNRFVQAQADNKRLKELNSMLTRKLSTIQARDHDVKKSVDSLRHEIDELKRSRH